MRSLGVAIGSSGRSELVEEDHDHDDVSKAAIASYQTRENAIEHRKLQIREKVESQFARAEEEAKRLKQVWEELEVFTDPMRKEVSVVRKKLDTANNDIKSLTLICQKKEKEYKEAMEAFQDKCKEKAQLTTALIQLVDESEKLRMKKLEELTKILNLNP
ncbi:uncharacterized protein LOC127259911 [Andrographis paniculata]|uniref:uncharacterized protein LOC127259911 n=1 Tax=Andrographis paniculata TaxID=175694 RepID=UPI0021E7F28E|nr:uncharacterized protein LOC127259911 [Andrographis paniculata]